MTENPNSGNSNPYLLEPVLRPGDTRIPLGKQAGLPLGCRVEHGTPVRPGLTALAKNFRAVPQRNPTISRDSEAFRGVTKY